MSGANQTFIDTFLGEYVEIILASESEGTLITRGFVLEITDTEIFIGTTPDAISGSIPRYGYKLITIDSPTSDEDALLDGLDIPKDKKEYN